MTRLQRPKLGGAVGRAFDAFAPEPAPPVACAYCGLAHPSERCNRPEGVAARGRKLRSFELGLESDATSREKAARGNANSARSRKQA